MDNVRLSDLNPHAELFATGNKRNEIQFLIATLYVYEHLNFFITILNFL